MRINNFIKPDIESNPSFYYLIGALRGDGYIKNTKNLYLIRLAVKDKDFAEYYHKILKQFIQFKIRYYYRCDDRWVVYFQSRDFIKFYNSIKEPQTKEQIIWYLKGLFDAEGCFCINVERKGCLTFANGNIYLLLQVKYLLKMLGIDSRCYIRDKKRSYLSITLWENKELFFELIGMRIERKRLLWEKFLANRKPNWYKNRNLKLYPIRRLEVMI